MGPVKGEELGIPVEEKQGPEAMDDVSEYKSLFELVRFRLSSLSISGSIESMLRYCQPCFILILARASRSCRARVI